MDISRSLLHFVILLAFGSLLGCAGARQHPATAETATQRTASEAGVPEPAAADPDSVSSSGQWRRGNAEISDSTRLDPNARPELSAAERDSASALHLHAHGGQKLYDSLFDGAVTTDDSSSAVDDYIWRQFDLADEYQSMGVIANREASWEEAQYYFEKALSILANLDIETDSSLTPEAVRYNTLLENILADYRVTLRSLGQLTDDVTPSVILDRFSDLETQLESDTLRVFKKESREITYDLPVIMNDRVRASIIYFQTVAKDAFTKYLSRRPRYERRFREILRKHGLPEDLIYLSMVESGYNPHAYSWARAMGLWQFISSTGRLYGLKRDWWIDERKDPVKATEAAARFLKDLHDRFGNWELAMAAYNGGPGRVSRTIKKQRTRDFWKLRLRRQTMDYVPLIYAACIIGKDPEKYGFTDIDYQNEVEWEETTIDRCLDLKDIAREVGCSLQELKDLNPELLRNYTPPNRKKYTLRLPVGKKPRFLAVYDRLPSPKETSWVKHKIRRGETVSSIASKYGVSQYAILNANNLGRRARIIAGKSLIVPVPLDREYARQSKRNHKYQAESGVYSVRSGDTMWDIARAFGTTVDALRRINSINRGSRIYVGQRLKIPTNARYLAKRNTKSDKTRSSSRKSYTQAKPRRTTASNTDAAKGKSGKYAVRSGDTLWDIARAHGMSTSQLRRLNGLGRTSRIYPGQILTVSASDYILYKVRRGDTLTRIARRYRTSVSSILAANDLDDADNLRVGDRLKIYTR